MQHVRIDNSTHTLPAPSNWDEDQSGRCGTLHARAEVIDGVQFLRSAWEADTREIGWQLVGAKIVLGVTPIRGATGLAHPVVHMGILPPPEDFAPAVTIRQYATLDGEPAIRVEMFTKGGVTFADLTLGTNDLASASALAIEAIEVEAKAQGWIK
jgi:hypothetical protein